VAGWRLDDDALPLPVRQDFEETVRAFRKDRKNSQALAVEAVFSLVNMGNVEHRLTIASAWIFSLRSPLPVATRSSVKDNAENVINAEKKWGNLNKQVKSVGKWRGLFIFATIWHLYDEIESITNCEWKDFQKIMDNHGLRPALFAQANLVKKKRQSSRLRWTDVEGIGEREAELRLERLRTDSLEEMLDVFFEEETKRAIVRKTLMQKVEGNEGNNDLVI
jgi:hypothetical protein